MKTLLLISPLAPSSLLGRDFYFRLPCLSLLKVAALTPAEWEVRVVDEKVEALDLNEEADLVGITAMTCTVNRAYEIADHFRRRGVKVALGGMHVSSLPGEALAHCDSVVVAEAVSNIGVSVPSKDGATLQLPAVPQLPEVPPVQV